MCVVSLRGRDAGHIFYVVGESPGRVLVADGRLHSTRRPKAKNPRHLRALARSTDAIDAWARAGAVPMDHELRRELESLEIRDEGGTEDL